MNPNLKRYINTQYQEKFNEKPIIVCSPGRINLIGEHTDYNEGFVFPAAIDKGIVTAIEKSQTELCTIYASDLDEILSFSLGDVQPIPNGNWRNFILGVVGELQKLHIEVKPFNMVFGGDLPKGAGLSSSAALENSVVYGLNTLFNLKLSKSQMILISQKAEHNYVGVRCGIMDQYASMFGEEDHALLLDCRYQKATSYKIDFKDYELMLINSNVSHNLVDAEYNDRRLVCEHVAKLLNVPFLRDVNEDMLLQVKSQLSESDYQKALYVVQENQRVIELGKALENNDLQALGGLLYKAHHGAQHQFKISCKELDFLVEETKKHSEILGARMMGGGFGGCTINIIKKSAVTDYSNHISKTYQDTFGINCTIHTVKLSQGTHIIEL
ncbi:galactokinase [Corallibacter sp.]|uniref:galactokinase n=1 Tax=Corallibacter sp. TaxID=2038084 RepID=UPI003A937800